MTAQSYTETVTGCTIVNERGEVMELNVWQDHDFCAWLAAQRDDRADDSDSVTIGQGGIASGESH